MKTQYVQDGVLVRPFEPAATRFLSSRYYDGRKVVDLLEDLASAQRWFDIMSQELDTLPVVLASEDELESLRVLRDRIGRLYGAVISGDVSASAAIFNEMTPELGFHPRAVPSAPMLNIDFSGEGDPVKHFKASILLSAATTVSPPELRRLHKCEGPNCVLYYSQLRDGQQWCSGTCGNRARVARHAEKQRG